MSTGAKKHGGSSTESTSGSTDSSSSSSSSGSDSSSSSDSESSSSQESTKQPPPEAPPKKTAPVPKNVHRKCSEGKTSSSVTSNAKSTKSVKTQPQKQSTSKPPVAPKTIYSSDDEDNPKNTSKSAKKKSAVIKPKSSATVTPRSTTKVTHHAPSKSQSQPQKVKTGGAKSPVKKPTLATHTSKKSDPNSKKKSIFSPENSSADSDIDSSSAKKRSKSVPPKPRPKAAARVVEKKVDKTPRPKPAASSASSASSTTSSSSSDGSESSDSSSGHAANSARKSGDSVKKSPVKKHSVTPPDSDGVTRKLTRSASTRKSKHLTGKNIYSDTDSDTESTKRSLSRSPVKRAPTTKGKTKNSKVAKSRASEIIIIEERKCPVEGCNSLGHLSGKHDKHFTMEACPFYHNTTSGECKEEATERKKREDQRRRAPPSDHKQYLQKIREIRMRFKPGPDEPTTSNSLTKQQQMEAKTREPDLSNFVSEYDLKLFRDAQAIASEKIEEDLKTQPNTKGTKCIEMGKFEMEVWYQSPYPEDYARLPKLYICEFCLRYMKTRTVLQRHVVKCVWRHPPGEEVYRKDKISVWEVDGKRYKQYCQNLCLLAKFFLDHKTLYYDVEPFLFYVMTMVDGEGCHTVGYFSKEKNSFLNYNVSCILTLPPYQRQGYGRLLIDFSYLLTRVEGKIGSPEKPLSDLGLISYRSYWKDVLLEYLCSGPNVQLSVKDISQEMAIHSYDIVSTLQALGMMKYWKGKHIILKKQDVLDEYIERVKKRGSLLKKVDSSCLRWIPPQPASV